MTGTELKVQRIEAHVQGQDLARALREAFPTSKWSPSKVSRIEAKAHVDPSLVDEYVAGLATLTTNATPSEQVA
jgi:hypothetical protein